MAKPDFSGAKRRGGEVLGVLAPGLVIALGWFGLMYFSSGEGKAVTAVNSAAGTTSGSVVGAEVAPEIAQIIVAASQLEARQDVVALSQALSDPKFYNQAQTEGTCGVIGLDVNSVADVLYRELLIGELSPKSDNILVFESDIRGNIEVHPYGSYRIGAADREYVDNSNRICIDKTLTTGSTVQ